MRCERASTITDEALSPTVKNPGLWELLGSCTYSDSDLTPQPDSEGRARAVSGDLVPLTAPPAAQPL